MTIHQAVVAEIEPYSVSDESVDKSIIDAAAHFGVAASTEADYGIDYKQIAGYAAMLCLNRLRVLVSEGVSGISSTYNLEGLERRIKAVAKSCGLSADLVLADSDDSISFIQM